VGCQWDGEAGQWYHTSKRVAEKAQQLVPVQPDKHFIEGDSYDLKDQLKQMGCRWDPESSRWYHSDRTVAEQAQKLIAEAQHKHFPTGDAFAVKDKLKELGCEWDTETKMWYHNDKEIAAQAQAVIDQGPERHYIQGASFDQRDRLKAAGAEWDPEAKAWFHNDKNVAVQLQASLSSPSPQAEDKHYVQGAPFELKQQLKDLGCQWDPEWKQWYHTDHETAVKAQDLVNQQVQRRVSAPELKGPTASAVLAASAEPDHGL
jgi:hypothetical protein